MNTINPNHIIISPSFLREHAQSLGPNAKQKIIERNEKLASLTIDERNELRDLRHAGKTTTDEYLKKVRP